jgi:hypothetical protein
LRLAIQLLPRKTGPLAVFNQALRVKGGGRPRFLLFLAGVFWLFAAGGRAEDFRLESAGMRFGFTANFTSKGFHQAEAFADLELPWRWQWASHWELQSKLDLAAGAFGDSAQDAAVTSAGPSLVLGYERIPLSLDVGFSPTLLSREAFGRIDLGSILQFTSHVGLNWDISSRFRLGYRFQHMSNGSLNSEHNPGVNLHVLALNYLF